MIKCPECGGGSKVSDSRSKQDGTITRRLRECLNCTDDDGNPTIFGTKEIRDKELREVRQKMKDHLNMVKKLFADLIRLGD